MAPNANPGGPYTGASAVTFDGSGSSDPDGNLPLTYSWAFGDGSTGTGVGPSHTYAAEGVYTVSLVVTDNKGKPSTPVTTTATIANVAPVVDAGADETQGPGQAFDLNATFTDAGGPSDAPWSYTITWGDGTTASGTTSTISAITGSHTYPAVGDFVVRVTVTDHEGAAAWDEMTVHVIVAQVLVGAGNIARCDKPNDELTANILDGVAGTVFTAGDGAMSVNNQPPDYINCYGPSWGRHLARTRPTFGSMDGFSPGGAAYYNYYGAAAGPVGKGYYSYDLGWWHIIVLNSAISMAAGSAQEVWLRADLAANPVQCTLAMWHHPRFTSAAAVDAGSLPLWNALYAAGAEVIVSAHYGQYERFAPQAPTGVADATNGIREFVVGTGGISQDAFGKILPNSQVRDNRTYGVLKFTLADGTYSWQFLPVAGKKFTDKGTGTCH